jgi:hypothetical protein
MSDSTQDKYYKYLEKDLFAISHIPNLDIIKNFVNGGVDLNGYVFTKTLVWKSDPTTPANTLLFALVRIIPDYSGTKSRLQRILDLMEYILNNGADIEQGYAKVSPRSRRPKTFVKRPLEYAIEKRITPAIRLLISHGATVYATDKLKWLQYIEEASGHERERLVEIMKLLQPGFKYRDSNNPETRNLPHNAENAISFDDIKNGTIMVDINEEYLGPPGVLGPHSHFYTKAVWDRWEAQQKALGLPITSPFTKKPLISKEVYKARVLSAPSEEENKKNNAQSSSTTNSVANSGQGTTTTVNSTTSNTSNTRSNNTQGGKRRKQKKTRKLKRRSVH